MADLIDRQAAIEAIGEIHSLDYNAQAIKARIEQLPPVQPERKTGKWLFTDAAPHRVYCSECYKTYVPNKKWSAWAEGMIPRNFCPNCGAEMRSDWYINEDREDLE